MDTDLKRSFVRSRRHIAESRPSILLEIQDRSTHVVGGRRDTPEFCESLSVGARSLSEMHFLHSPPSAMDLERAIYQIEDEVMRTRQSVPMNTVLVTTDTGMLPVLAAAEAAEADSPVLSLDAVEQLYQRLAAIAEGRPVTQDDIPLDSDFVARILILREFMHHLGFSEISFVFDSEA